MEAEPESGPFNGDTLHLLKVQSLLDLAKLAPRAFEVISNQFYQKNVGELPPLTAHFVSLTCRELVFDMSRDV